MNYNEIENLVALAKANDKKAKEELMVKFTPLILNLSKKTFVNSYEFADIKNECYHTLFKCVRLYNPSKHRFVGYATNAIKNCINLLIRVSIRRSMSDGPEAFTLDGNLENTLTSIQDDAKDFLLSSLYISNLKAAIESLTLEEQELLTFIYYADKSARAYSKFKGIAYATAINRKNKMLSKLRDYLIKANNYNVQIQENPWVTF